MKFVHIADVHFDTPLIALRNNRELIKKRRQEHKQVFKDVIKLIKEQKIELFFISGDLFEQKYVDKSTIEFIISNLKLIPDTKIFIAPGNHDPYIKNSPYIEYEWPENVKIFRGAVEKVSVEDVDIYGFGFEDFELIDDLLSDFKVEDDGKVNVLVTHGTLDGSSKYNDISSKDLEQFDYVALGHIHLPKLDNNVVYPGNLVQYGFDRDAGHGFILGNIENGKVTYEFIEPECKCFKTVEIDVTNARIVSDVLEMLHLDDDIYRVCLTGTKNIDINDVTNAILEANSNVCDVRDETILPYDLEKIALTQDLKGIFTRKMLEHLRKNPSDKEVVMKAIEIAYASL